MNGLNDPIKSQEQNSTCHSRKNGLPINLTEDLEANLADEMAEFLGQADKPVDLPAFEPEEFESLYSWFIS